MIRNLSCKWPRSIKKSFHPFSLPNRNKVDRPAREVSAAFYNSASLQIRQTRTCVVDEFDVSLLLLDVFRYYVNGSSDGAMRQISQLRGFFPQPTDADTSSRLPEKKIFEQFWFFLSLQQRWNLLRIPAWEARF